MIYRFFALILLLLSSFAYSNERVFLLHDETNNDLLIQRDFEYFNRLKFNNRILSKYFGYQLNQRQEIVTWLRKSGLVILGSKFEYHVCFNKPVKGTQLVPCNEEYNPRQASLKSVVKSFLLDKSMSIFFPKATLDKKKIDGGFVLNNGRMVRFNGYSPAIVLEKEPLPDSSRLDEEAISLYRVAHIMGLMRTKEIFISRNENGWSKCDAIIGKIKCDTNLDGAFSITGTMLSIFAKECVSCSENSRVMLNYYAANYLLRVPGSNDIQFLGRKVYLDHRNDIKRVSPADGASLEMLYRWALSTRLSAQ